MRPTAASGAACDLARAADAVIVFAGNHPTCNAGWAQCSEPTEGKEAVDRKAIHLPDEEWIRRVFAANPRTILVLVSSFPYAIVWSKEHLPAILWSSHAGQELGDAVADTLFGDSAPAGRLTQTWYRSLEGLPPITDYDIIRGKRTYLYFDGEPLFPFGHGLTYAPFRYANLKLGAERIGAAGTVSVSCDVTNAGSRASDEVVQLYAHARASRVIRPIKELKAFERIASRAGGNPHGPFRLSGFRAGVLGCDPRKVGGRIRDLRSDDRAVFGGSPPAGFDNGRRGNHPGAGIFRSRRARRISTSTTTCVWWMKPRRAGTRSARRKTAGWIAFCGSIFPKGTARFSARVSNDGKKTVEMEIRFDRPDGPAAARISVPVTKDRYDYAEVEAPVSVAAGVHDVYLVFRGKMRISTFQFEE